jgi:hypothetical protein
MVAGSKTYCAPSPQSDLKGQPSFVLGNSSSNNGLKRTLAKSKDPSYDSTAEEYTGFIQMTTTLNRLDTETIADVQVRVNTHIALLTLLNEELANGAY